MADKREIENDLAASLKTLAVRIPFEKITIKQITDGAGVIRVTFYNHFQDKYDLLEWIIREQILEPVRILFQNRMYRDAIILIFTNVVKDKEFYRKVSKLEGQNSFAEIVEKNIYEFLQSEFARLEICKKPEHPWMTSEYLGKFYAVSMTFVVIEWIRKGMTVSPGEMATLYEYIARRSMWDVLDEMQEK